MLPCNWNKNDWIAALLQCTSGIAAYQPSIWNIANIYCLQQNCLNICSQVPPIFLSLIRIQIGK